MTAASYQALTPNTTPTDVRRTDSFVYDQLGNRKGQNTLATRGVVSFNRRDNGLNQYLSWNPPQAGINYETNGDLTQEGYINASFNALNQPISISSSSVVPAGSLVWFGHDPLGRCVKRWVSDLGDPYTNPATYFHYDGWNLLQEGGNAWGPERVYMHGNRIDEIVASYNTWTGEFAFHHYDARGHCITLTDRWATILEQYEYDAFGKPYFYDGTGTSLPDGSSFGNRFLFTGREWLREVGVYDFRNRHYLPELGRFIQPDPMGLVGNSNKGERSNSLFLSPWSAPNDSKSSTRLDSNLYRYCHNDPVNGMDPTGLFEIYVGVEGDLVPILGGEAGGGIVINFSEPLKSGLFGSIGLAGGGNVGIGVGGGFALRTVEGKSLNGDVNLGKVSVTASADEKGFNGMGVSVGPGVGASASVQNTKTLTIEKVRDWIRTPREK